MAINATIKYFKTDDDLNLFYQHWVPQNPKALLVFVHDLGGHTGLHGKFIKYFVEHGYAVALYDQRGHGRSEGKRGDVSEFSVLVRDLSYFIQFSRTAVLASTPILPVGLGFGGQLLINLLVPSWHAVSWGGRPPGKIDGFVCLSALIAPIIKTSKWKARVTERVGRFFPSAPIKADFNPYGKLSFRRDCLVNRRISFRFQNQILQNVQLIMAMASRIQTPALMLHGSDDKITSPDGTKQFYLRLPSPAKRMHLYDNGPHDLTNECAEEKVFADIESWFVGLKSSSVLTTHAGVTKEELCDLLPLPF